MMANLEGDFELTITNSALKAWQVIGYRKSGQSHLIGSLQDPKKIGGIPSGFEPFDFDAYASRLLAA